MLWNARVVVRPQGRERVIQEVCEIHVHQTIARIKSLARSHVLWVSLDADLEAKVRTCTKCQSSGPPELVSCPDPLAHATEGLVF